VLSEELLRAAIAAAPPTEAGTTALESLIPAATEALHSARRKVKEAGTEMDALTNDKERVSARMTAVKQELSNLRPQLAATIVAALSDSKGGRSAVNKVCQQRAALVDEQIGLSETWDWLEAASFGLKLQQAAAQIAETARSRDWVYAAGVAALHELHRAFLVVLQADPAATFELGPGSKVSAYVEKLNSLDLALVGLRTDFRDFEQIAARVQEREGV
jgi:hypothetical protein